MTAQRKLNYPMGSISFGTMRPEDLIPTFCDQLHWLAVHKEYGNVSAETRKAHVALFTEIMDRTESDDYYHSEDASYDLNETLFDALNEYAAPYFYFGSHPGDGADYGFWLSEDWDIEFHECTTTGDHASTLIREHVQGGSIKVSDLSEVPSWFRGEIAVINDHGNVTLYSKTARSLREIWSVV